MRRSEPHHPGSTSPLRPTERSRRARCAAAVRLLTGPAQTRHRTRPLTRLEVTETENPFTRSRWASRNAFERSEKYPSCTTQCREPLGLCAAPSGVRAGALDGVCAAAGEARDLPGAAVLVLP